MTSVNDVQLQENYIFIEGLSEEHRPVVKVIPQNRDWSRSNVEMDLRYIESVLWGALAMMPEHVTKMIIVVDCSEINIFFHYAPTLYARLIKNMRTKFRDRIYEIRAVKASMSTRIMYWMYQNEFPYGIQSKIRWVI